MPCLIRSRARLRRLAIRSGEESVLCSTALLRRGLISAVRKGYRLRLSRDITFRSGPAQQHTTISAGRRYSPGRSNMPLKNGSSKFGCQPQYQDLGGRVEEGWIDWQQPSVDKTKASSRPLPIGIVQAGKSRDKISPAGAMPAESSSSRPVLLRQHELSPLSAYRPTHLPSTMAASCRAQVPARTPAFSVGTAWPEPANSNCVTMRSWTG